MFRIIERPFARSALIRPLLNGFFCFFILLAGCSRSASQVALFARAQGDNQTFCRISFQNSHNDPDSMNNLGICYEEGAGEFTRDLDSAKLWYVNAAKMGCDNAITNLNRLGVPTPPEYFAVKQRTKIQNEQIVAGVLAAAVLGAMAYHISKNSDGTDSWSNLSSGNNHQVYTYNRRFRPLFKTFEGCCSRHRGIAADDTFIVCRSDNQLMCMDGEASPTCRCD